MVGVALGAATIGAVGSIASGAMGASASADAAKQQQKMAEMQYMLAQQAFKKNRKELLPYSKFGTQQLPQYAQAMDEYAAMLPGYGQRLSAYDQAVANYTGQGIGGVNEAMAGYRGAVDRYGNAVNAYQAAIPDMTGAYTMDQYRQSPLYTPMVNNLAELQATPGYQFQLQQGQQALNQTAAARGGLLSGAQLKAAQGFGQQQAATGFQSAWERAQAAYQNAFAQNLQRQRQLGDVLTGGANLAGQEAGLYGAGVNQAMGRAGLYQNAAGMQNTAAGLYGQGLGYQQENVANRGNAARFGYGAARDIATQRSNAANIQGQAAGNYGDAGAAGTLAGAGAWQKSLGSLGYLGGALGNYAAQNNWFGGGPAKSYDFLDPAG